MNTAKGIDNWWRRFFEHADCLDLALFPSEETTQKQVEGLQGLLDLQMEDRIADICCGYGRHAWRLTRLGYNVTGLDISRFLLDCGTLLMEDEGVRAPLVQGNAAALPFADETFDVVMNLFNSFGYFADEGQNEAVLDETRRILKPGGRFFLDTRNRQYQILYAPYGQTMRTADGRELILRCKYNRDTHRLVSRWLDKNNDEELVHEASIRLYGPDELQQMLSDAGFQKIGVYGTYNGETFSGHHRQLLILARRR